MAVIRPGDRVWVDDSRRGVYTESMSDTFRDIGAGGRPPCISEVRPPHVLPQQARSVAACFTHPIPPSIARALDVVLPREIERAVPKRRAEYLAGRWCARRAVRALLPHFAGQIAHRDRAPAWPAGIHGSITHSGRFACAAVISSRDALGVGIDSEEVGGAERIAAIRELACAEAEQDRAPELPEALHYTLIFSAKESLFKCLFPAVGRMFWYEDARVTLCPTTATFRATLLVDLSTELRRGNVFDGTYRVADRLVHTALIRLRGSDP